MFFDIGENGSFKCVLFYSGNLFQSSAYGIASVLYFILRSGYQIESRYVFGCVNTGYGVGELSVCCCLDNSGSRLCFLCDAFLPEHMGNSFTSGEIIGKLMMLLHMEEMILISLC